MAQDKNKIGNNVGQTIHSTGSVHGYGQSIAPGGTTASLGLTSSQVLPDAISSQARSSYRSGYLLSLAQNEIATSQSAGQRHDDAFIIPTRTKMNAAFSRATTSEFGSESMFESVSKHRHRDNEVDEDGPPSTFVADLINDVHKDTHKTRQQILPLPAITSASISTKSYSPAFLNQVLSVVVFGYPQLRYSSTVAHFEALAAGGTTKAEPISEVENAFKIGYNQPWEAARALRKNGEIIGGEGGRWLIGVKWADPLIAQQVLGTAVTTSFNSLPSRTDEFLNDHMGFEESNTDFLTSEKGVLSNTNIQSEAIVIGTPLELAPSSFAFRQTSQPKDNTNERRPGQHEVSSKGMLGQVSDLIFGW